MNDDEIKVVEKRAAGLDRALDMLGFAAQAADKGELFHGQGGLNGLR